MLGDRLCPGLYEQYKEAVGVVFIISSASVLYSLWHFALKSAKNWHNLYKRKKLKTKSKDVILEALNHLNSAEEKIIRSMIGQNRNNTSSFGSRYTCDLDGLYMQGILCQRDMHETSIFESEIEYMDPLMWEEYRPIRDYKMPYYVWENAKNNPRFTTSIKDDSGEDLPF